MKSILRRSLTMLVLAVLMAWPVLAQEKSAPKVIIKEDLFDFREVKEGETIEHSFDVKNAGDQTLEIKEVKPG